MSRQLPISYKSKGTLSYYFVHPLSAGEGKDLEEPNVIKAEKWNFVPEPKGMGYAFFHAMIKYKHETAQVRDL